MKLRFLCFFLILLTASGSLAQRVERRAATSIVIKLRTTQALSDLALQAKVQTATGIGLSPSQAFHQSTRSNTLNVAPQGLERIFVVPIHGPRDAENVSSSLRAEELIEYVEPNYIYSIDAVETPNDPDYDQQWYLRNIRADRAWEFTKGDTTIAIGVVDTGVDWLHPDLSTQFRINKAEDLNGNGAFDAWPSTEQRKDIYGKMVNGDLDDVDQDRNGYPDDVIGYDFVDQESLNFGDSRDRDPIPGDEHGHGTSVSGVIAARQNNAKGISGIAPNCRVLALRAFDATGNAEDDDIASAIVYAVDNGVRIVNLSFGDIVPSMLHRDAIRYAVSQGVTVFASSGNEGGFDRHYPSDFDEVISVGGTTNDPFEDLLWSRTVRGEGMDLVAPGDRIYTSWLDGGYRSVSGTSYSSPIAASVAALLLAKDPRLTPSQIKGILTSTTRDLGVRGSDPETANGRVDALSALSYKGSATIDIHSPHTNDGIRVGEEITVSGTVLSTLFESWQLSFARSLDPDTLSIPDAKRGWRVIAEGGDQRINATLGTWNTAGFEPGLYTLRLALRSNDGRSTEERTIVHLVGESLKIARFSVDSIYVHDKRGLLVQITSDKVSRLVVRYREEGSAAWSQKSDDRMTKGHVLILTTNDLRSGIRYQIEAVLTSTSGDSVIASNIATLTDEAIPQRGFLAKPYSLPPGYALDSVLTIGGSGHVAMSVFPDGINFGPLKAFRFNGTRFEQIDTLKEAWIPRDFGNTRGSGTELLMQASNNAQLYSIGSGKFLQEQVFKSSGEFWGSALADIDGDGLKDIIGKSSDASGDILKALGFKTGAYRELGVMRNETSRITSRTSNRFLEVNVAHADLDGDGREEILAIDNDADMMLFSYNGSQFTTVFKEENEGAGDGSCVALGDVNGDGKPDIVYAFHSDFDQNRDREYEPSFWTVKVLLNEGAFNFKKVFEDRFNYARPLNPYRSSVTAIPNVTGRGGENIVLSLFPNLYLLEWNTATNSLQPVWHYPSSLSPRGAVAFDFDRNGIREFGFVAGDSIRFFERDEEYADRTITPGGLTVTPLGSAGVLLDWGRVEGAEGYLVLRGAQGSGQLLAIDSVGFTSYFDEDIQLGDTLIYSVIAIDDQKPIAQSQIAFVERAVTHPLPRVVSVLPVKSGLKIYLSEKLKQRSVSGAQFLLDDSINISTAILASDSSLILTSSVKLIAGQHTLRATSWELRDVFNSPLDTSVKISFTQPETSEDTARFYAVRWRFEGSRRVHVEFNSIPGDDALDVSHYELSPFGKLTKVYRDTADTKALYIDLDAGTQIIALGKPFVLCIDDIHDIYGIAIDPVEGRCIGVTLTEADLTNVMVYPNPVKRSDAELMFARLTAEAEISIYTVDMKFLRRIRTSERNGGAPWDLRDENGQDLPSGIYLYYVTGKNDDGVEVEANTQKFVIIADR